MVVQSQKGRLQIQDLNLEPSFFYTVIECHSIIVGFSVPSRTSICPFWGCFVEKTFLLLEQESRASLRWICLRILSVPMEMTYTPKTLISEGKYSS